MLVKGSMPIGIRIALNSDSRFSKANFGSQKNYAISAAMFQKRLGFDNSLLSMNPTLCIITDLQ